MDQDETKYNGFYIDIGSSNLTYLLEHKYHWSGICVDANSSIIENTIKDRPNSKCINSLIWSYHTYLDFEIETNNSLSGRVCNIPYNDKLNGIVSKQLLEAKTLEQSCNDTSIVLPSTIDYIILDCNGSEIYILDDLLFQNSIHISNMSIRYYSNKYLQKLLEKIKYSNTIYLSKINNKYIDLSDTKNNNQSVWICDRGYFSILSKKSWHGYIDNKYIDNLKMVESNEHCKILSNGMNTYNICNTELYEIILNNSHKITDGAWI